MSVLLDVEEAVEVHVLLGQARSYAARLPGLLWRWAEDLDPPRR